VALSFLTREPSVVTAVAKAFATRLLQYRCLQPCVVCGVFKTTRVPATRPRLNKRKILNEWFENEGSVKFIVFWDVLSCSQVNVDRRLRAAYCLHHQGDDDEDSKLHTRRRKNLKSHKSSVLQCYVFFNV
jgi:hypothetical protein